MRGRGGEGSTTPPVNASTSTSTTSVYSLRRRSTGQRARGVGARGGALSRYTCMLAPTVGELGQPTLGHPREGVLSGGRRTGSRRSG